MTSSAEGLLGEVVSVDARHTGVLLVNTGSPSEPTPAAVKRYLAQFLMDPNVRPMPAAAWWPILHAFILPKRKHASAAKYREIWTAEGSPLLAAAAHLASRTESLLRSRLGADAPLVRAAMSYGEPGVASVLRELRAMGVERLVAIPLYPQSARSTSGAVMRRVREALRRLHWTPELIEVGPYADDPLYLDAVAESVRVAGFDPALDRIAFSFHSVPRPDVEAGDTYPAQVDATCHALATKLGIAQDRWLHGFQSPFEDNRTWVDPFTIDLLGDAFGSDTRDFYLVCPGFSLDCLETLYDVEHEFRPLVERAAAAAPGGAARHRFVYVPCLNAGDAHVQLMTTLIERAL